MDQGWIHDPADLAAVEVSRLLAPADGLRDLVELARREADARMATLPAKSPSFGRPHDVEHRSNYRG
jgi:hypothetical protein